LPGGEVNLFRGAKRDCGGERQRSRTKDVDAHHLRRCLLAGGLALGRLRVHLDVGVEGDLLKSLFRRWRGGRTEGGREIPSSNGRR